MFSTGHRSPRPNIPCYLTEVRFPSSIRQRPASFSFHFEFCSSARAWVGSLKPLEADRERSRKRIAILVKLRPENTGAAYRFRTDFSPEDGLPACIPMPHARMVAKLATRSERVESIVFPARASRKRGRSERRGPLSSYRSFAKPHHHYFGD